jgi:hypothetical protein
MVSKGFKEADVDDRRSYIKERIAYWKVEEKKRGTVRFAYPRETNVY